MYNSRMTTMPKTSTHIYYELKYDNITFYAEVTHVNTMHATIKIGGVKNGCAVIYLTKQKPRAKWDANLLVGYETLCNKDGNLRRGSGTKTMILTSICFAFQLFPKLECVGWKDQSTVNCGERKMNLAPYMLIKYGKTWYQRFLPATVEFDENRTNLESFVASLHNPLHWDTLWDNIKLYIPIQKRTEIQQAIHDAWNAGNHSLSGMMKHNGDCMLYCDWLSVYVDKYAKMPLADTSFIVKREDIMLLPAYTNLQHQKIEQNPYQHEIQRRTEQLKDLDRALNQVPRIQMGNGLYHGRIFGDGPLSDEEWANL